MVDSERAGIPGPPGASGAADSSSSSSSYESAQSPASAESFPLTQTPMEWRFDFFHAWLRLHQPAPNGRCREARCYADRAKHPCELRQRAVAELVRDGHVSAEGSPEIERGLACCAAAQPPASAAAE